MRLLLLAVALMPAALVLPPAPGARHAEAEDALPGRSVGPLPARRRLVPRGRPRRPGHRSSTGRRRPAPAAGGRRTVPVAPSTPATSPLPATWAPSTGTARTSRRPRAGARRVGAAVRVGQLPREGLAERHAARLPRRRLPAVRAARASGSAERPSTASSCASTAAGRSTTSRRCRCAATALSREAGGTTTGSCARSTCARSTRSTSSASFVQPAASLRRCAATVDVIVDVANVNRRGRRRVDHGHVRRRGLRFHAKRVPGRGDSAFQRPASGSPSRGCGGPERPVSLHGAAAAARRRPGRAALRGPHGIRTPAGQPARPGAAERPRRRTCAAPASTRTRPTAGPR